jgi:Rieske Fe-S protein
MKKSKDSGSSEDPRPEKLDSDAASKKAQGLEVGQGVVVKIKGKKEPRAFYKDGDGKVMSFSAVCTHLGCTVNWNDSEKSFDCPCHGSRFSYKGRVVNGPANDDLESR